MARQFGSYSPVVPLGLTWEESITLQDSAGAAIDLTGYAVRAQLRPALVARDPDTGLGASDPLLELTSASYYGSAPAWDVIEALSIPTPANGTILLTVPAADTWKLAPTNVKTKLLWDLALVNTGTGYAIPVVSGKVSALPRVTI